MTAVILSCVFNLSWARACQAFSDILLVTFLFNVYKRFLLMSCFYIFNVLFFSERFFYIYAENVIDKSTPHTVEASLKMHVRAREKR